MLQSSKNKALTSLENAKEILLDTMKIIPELYDRDKRKWKVRGGISFFMAEESVHTQKKLLMHFAELDSHLRDEQVLLFIKKSFPLRELYLNNNTPEKIKEEIIARIEYQKHKENSFLATEEVDRLSCFKHFVLEPKANIRHQNVKEAIQRTIQNPAEEWNTHEASSLDYFNFLETEHELLKIPLSFLSTPVIHLLISKPEKGNINTLIRNVFFYTRDAVYSYFHELLIKNLQNVITGKENFIKKEEDLVSHFVGELCKILLPLKYSIAKNEALQLGKYLDYTKQWEIKRWHCGSSDFELELSTLQNQYKAGFELTSFHFPTGTSIGDKEQTQWIHHLPEYMLYRKQVKTMLESIFSLLYKQWMQVQEISQRSEELEKKRQEAENHAAKAAISKIINRNYAHHIGSHVSHRSTPEQISARVWGQDARKNIQLEQWQSLSLMQNILNKYKDERNEFISGIDNNLPPVTFHFYKDVIQPFIENSLLMDNLAKSEGVCWQSELKAHNSGKVLEKGINKLRIRVFYHKSLHFGKAQNQCPNAEKCDSDYPCTYKSSNQHKGRLSLKELGIDENWCEMMAFYHFAENKSQEPVCIHKLPYFKSIAPDKSYFYQKLLYTLEDIKVVLPGTLGAHCIYSLLENKIRNTVKHAKTQILSEDLPVSIILKISKKDKTTFQNGNSYFNFEITSNVPTLFHDSELDKITAALSEPINATKALGFADMRINANLLVFKEFNHININKSIEKPQTYASQHSSGASVAYALKLMKPLKVLFVGEGFSAYKQEAYENAGIVQYDTIDLCMEQLQKRASFFEFAVIEYHCWSKLKNDMEREEFTKKLPWRVLIHLPKPEYTLTEDTNRWANQRKITLCNSDILQSASAEDLYRNCWKLWMEERWKPPYSLNMYFDMNASMEEKYSFSNKMPQDGILGYHIHKNQATVLMPQKEAFSVFYDRHGKLLQSISNSCKGDYHRLSWIYLDKNNPDYDTITQSKVDEPEVFISKLIENGLHKVLVIDERAKETAIKNKGNRWLGQKAREQSYSLFAMGSRVFIADSFVVNNEEMLFSEHSPKDNNETLLQLSISKDIGIKFSGKYAGLTHFEKKCIFSGFDTLIIHRTMFTKVLENNCFQTINTNFPNIVVTTGGGSLSYPEPIMNRIRMIPFSAINNYLLKGAMAKNTLLQLL